MIIKFVKRILHNFVTETKKDLDVNLEDSVKIFNSNSHDNLIIETTKNLVCDSVWDSVCESVCESVFESIYASIFTSINDTVEGDYKK